MSAVLKKAVKLNHSLTGPVMGFSSPGNWFVAWQQQIIDWTEWQCRPIVPWKLTSMKWKYNSNHFPGELVQAADNLAPCVARPSTTIVLNTRDMWVLNCCMMTLSNGNIFRVTGPLCGEFAGHRGIALTKASDAELWCFLWSALEQTV